MTEEKGKFLFYYTGIPVYEGDDTHKMLERCRVEFNGNMFDMAKFDLEQVNKILNSKNENNIQKNQTKQGK